MPNDCSNSFTISFVTTDQWQKLSDSFEVRGDHYQQDFLKTFFPEPDWKTIPNEKGHLPGPSYTGKRGYPESPKFPDGTPDQRWYGWRIDNWGTKWDVYDCCNDCESKDPSGEFSASFSTAWSPLSEKCMGVLSKQFPGAVLTNSYSELMNDFCGVTVAKDGLVLEYCTDISKLKETWAQENHPGLWEKAENPEDEDATEELYELWYEVEADVIDGHLSPVAEDLIRQVMEQTSAPTTSDPAGQK